MRPDDLIWMHQLGYLLTHRGTGNDPIRTEPPYNELLAELHASTVGRERLALADASSVIASGGPDESDKDLFPAQLVVAAGDLVSADVVGLSILSGSHLDLVPETIRLLREHGVDAPVIVGGIIPEEDRSKLAKAGVSRVYTPKDYRLATIISEIADLAIDHRERLAPAT